MKHVLLTAAAGLAAFSFVSGAAAQDVSPDRKQIVVSYGDLDLSSRAGAERMLGRLKIAAEKVCGDRPDRRVITAMRVYNRCIATALDNAVADVDAPLVAALHSERFDQRLARHTPAKN